MGNLFASTGLGDEKPHERDVEYCGFAGRRPYERQNENPETPAVHTLACDGQSYGNLSKLRGQGGAGIKTVLCAFTCVGWCVIPYGR